MDLSDLIGKKFKYDSPVTGLSDWTDTVESIFSIYKVKLSQKGFKLQLQVRGKETGNVYEFEHVVFI